MRQIDVNANTADPFSEKDERFLEWVNEQVTTIINFSQTKSVLHSGSYRFNWI